MFVPTTSTMSLVSCYYQQGGNLLAQFYKVQVYLWDKFSEVDRISETEVNTFVILVNTTN